jgi:hypothetical protein
MNAEVKRKLDEQERARAIANVVRLLTRPEEDVRRVFEVAGSYLGVHPLWLEFACRPGLTLELDVAAVDLISKARASVPFKPNPATRLLRRWFKRMG